MKIRKISEELAETIFSDKFQAKALMWVFGVLGTVFLVYALFNTWGYFFAMMCGALFAAGLNEYKKCK